MHAVIETTSVSLQLRPVCYLLNNIRRPYRSKNAPRKGANTIGITCWTEPARRRHNPLARSPRSPWYPATCAVVPRVARIISALRPVNAPTTPAWHIWLYVQNTDHSLPHAHTCVQNMNQKNDGISLAALSVGRRNCDRARSCADTIAYLLAFSRISTVHPPIRTCCGNVRIQTMYPNVSTTFTPQMIAGTCACHSANVSNIHTRRHFVHLPRGPRTTLHEWKSSELRPLLRSTR